MPLSFPTLRTPARATSLRVIVAAAGVSLFVAAPAFASARRAPAAAVASDSLGSAEARAHRDSANAFWQKGDLRRAQREFLASARIVREAGALPAADMNSAAAAAYGRNRVLDAAWILSVLANDAAAFGRPDVQAKALMDAASLYASGGNARRAQESLAALRPLLSSPFVTDGVRQQAATLMQTAQR